MMGCTRNSRNALVKIVIAESSMNARSKKPGAADFTREASHSMRRGQPAESATRATSVRLLRPEVFGPIDGTDGYVLDVDALQHLERNLVAGFAAAPHFL